MATLGQAIDQMYADGMPSLPGGELKCDGKIHRYGPKGYGKSGRAVYKVYPPYRARNGKDYVSGWYRIFGDLEITKIRSDHTGMDDDERARLKRDQAALEAQERERRADKANRAANRARAQWGQARAEPTATDLIPYMAKKGLRWAKGLKFMPDGTLLVPAIRYDITEEMERHPEYTGPRRLVSLQKIGPDGQKRFNKDGAVKGAAFRAGAKPKDGDLIMLGEGLATVLSVLQALEGEYAAFVAFSADNLIPVAKILRGLYPASPLLILADDDAYVEAQLNAVLRGEYGVVDLYRADGEERILPGKDGPVTVRASVYDDGHGVPILTAGITAAGRTRTVVKMNAGRTRARAAAGEVRNAWVCYPVFAARDLGPDPEASRITDFNDLQAVQGVDYVRLQVAEQIKLVRDAIDLAKAMANGTAPKPEAAAGKGGGKDGSKDPDWRLHDALLKRFTQIYPSDTAYDDDKGRVVKIEHMRLRFGGDSISRWLGSKDKRVIDPEQIVFDPSCTSDPETTVNLFRGLPEQPKAPAGSCGLLIDLLHYLCGENVEDTSAPITLWVLRWMAFPLQHLGAKMQTAVVMHGEEGTGKNLVWGALRKIYGRHGGVITQRQLEDKFNTWQSAKLFVVANEVVTRQEMSHQGGYIRNLITEPEVQINPKFQDQREEANHMNIVFLANAIQPLLLGPNDRRCMVIRTPNPRPKAFYDAVGAEVAAGGVAAFYKHLMDLDLGDFSEHTKPPLTDAKRALIEVSMPTPQLFWQELKEGLLGLPYVPALATDLYKAYCVFCARNGYKMPEGMKFFSPNFMAMNGVRRVDRLVPEPGRQAELAMVGTAEESKLRKRRVFLMGKPELDDAAEKARIVRGVSEFRSCLREYLREETAYGGQASQGQGDSERAV